MGLRSEVGVFQRSRQVTQDTQRPSGFTARLIQRLGVSLWLAATSATQPKRWAFVAACLVWLATSACIQPNLPERCLPAGNDRLIVANGLAASLSSVDLDDSGTCEFVTETGPSPNDFQVAGDTLWLVTSGDNRLTAYDSQTFEVTRQIHLGDGANPWFFRVDPWNPARGFVTQWLKHSLDVIHLETGVIDTSLPLQIGDERPHPQGLDVSENLVAVTLTHFRQGGEYGTGEVAVFSRATLTQAARFDTCTNPTVSLLMPDRGELHVLCAGGVQGDGGAASDDGLAIIYDLASWRELRRVALGASPGRAVRSLDGDWVYASAITHVVGYEVDATEAAFPSSQAILSASDDLPFLSDVVQDPTAGPTRLIVFDFTNSAALWVSPSEPERVLRRAPLGLGAQFGVIMTDQRND